MILLLRGPMHATLKLGEHKGVRIGLMKKLETTWRKT